MYVPFTFQAMVSPFVERTSLDAILRARTGFGQMALARAATPRRPRSTADVGDEVHNDWPGGNRRQRVSLDRPAPGLGGGGIDGVLLALRLVGNHAAGAVAGLRIDVADDVASPVGARPIDDLLDGQSRRADRVLASAERDHRPGDLFDRDRAERNGLSAKGPGHPGTRVRRVDVCAAGA